VEDVAAGHALALERGRAGERYILGGEDVSLREAFGLIARHAGRRPPRIPVPYRVALSAAHAAALASAVTGRLPRLLVLDEVRLARLPLYFSSAKAKTELGYSPRPAAQALAEATEWFLGGYGVGWSSGSGSEAARSSSRARRSAVDSART
jgi:dihydroflavonol-4-reductase